MPDSRRLAREAFPWAIALLLVGAILGVLGVAFSILIEGCAWDRIDPRSQQPSTDYPCGPMYNCCAPPSATDRCLAGVYVCRTPGHLGGGCEAIPQEDDFASRRGDAGQ